MTIYLKIIAILAGPLGVLLAFVTAGVYEKLEASRSASEIAHVSVYAADLGQLVHELQKERGMSSGLIASGGAKFAEDLEVQRAVTDRVAASIAEARVRQRIAVSSPEMAATLKAAEEALSRLPTWRARVQSSSIGPSDAVRSYTTMVDAMLAVSARLPELSKEVGLAQSLRAYSAFLTLEEKTGLERAALSAAFARDRFDRESLKEVYFALAEKQAAASAFAASARREHIEQLASLASSPAAEEAARMEAVALARADVGRFGVDPEAWFRAATARLERLFEVERSLAEDLEREAHQAARAAQTAFAMNLAGGAVATISAALVGLWVARSIRRPLLAAGESALSVSVQVVSLLRELSATATETAAAVAQTTAAASAIRRTAELEVKRAKEMAEAANRSLSAGEQGMSALAAGLEAMQRIRAEARAIAGRVEELGARSEEVDAIAQVVNGLAESSMILAINASIEATGAGEQGKRFGVVAGEVRGLSERSKSAAKQIRQIMSQIRTASDATVEAAKQGVRLTEDGARRIEDLGEVVRTIGHTIQKSGKLASAISSEVEQQLVETEQIAESMGHIKQAVAEGAYGLRKLEESATVLTGVNAQIVTVLEGRRAAA